MATHGGSNNSRLSSARKGVVLEEVVDEDHLPIVYDSDDNVLDDNFILTDRKTREVTTSQYSFHGPTKN